MADLRIAIISLCLLCSCNFTQSAQASFLKQIDERGVRGDAQEEPGERLADAVQAALVCQEDGVHSDEGLQNLCPVSCFRPDPVCGEDGVTYWCGCRDARCAGVAVSHVGFCKIRSSASAEKGSQALLLLHGLWLVLLGVSCLFGLLP